MVLSFSIRNSIESWIAQPNEYRLFFSSSIFYYLFRSFSRFYVSRLLRFSVLYLSCLFCFPCSSLPFSRSTFNFLVFSILLFTFPLHFVFFPFSFFLSIVNLWFPSQHITVFRSLVLSFRSFLSFFFYVPFSCLPLYLYSFAFSFSRFSFSFSSLCPCRQLYSSIIVSCLPFVWPFSVFLSRPFVSCFFQRFCVSLIISILDISTLSITK